MRKEFREMVIKVITSSSKKEQLGYYEILKNMPFWMNPKG
jgi:hypothetical protein